MNCSEIFKSSGEDHLGTYRRRSRENGDLFAMTEAARVQPSKEGGPGTYKPRKTISILILSSAIPWAFEFFGQDIGQVSRLRFGKFTAIF